jgi:hypothetical protein
MDNFFSNSNVDFIYGLVRDKVLQQTSYDIDVNSKYYSKMKPLMKKVYTSVDQHNRGDLTTLNKKTVSNIIPFFKGLAEKKMRTQGYGVPNQIRTNYGPNVALNPMDNPVSPNSQYDTNLEMTLMKNKDNVGRQMDSLQKERNMFNRQLQPQNNDGMPDFRSDMNIDNTNISKEYENMVNNRDSEMRNHNQNTTPTPAEIEEFQNQIKIGNFNSTPRNNQSTGFELEPFEFDNNMGRDLGEPVYNNLNTMGSDMDIKKLHQELQNNRQGDIEDYQLYQQQQQEMKQAEDETKSMSIQQQSQMTSMDEIGSYLERRGRAGINTQQSELGMKSSDLYSPVQINDMQNVHKETEQKILQHVDNQSYFINKLPQENELFNKYLNGLREGKDQFGMRNYIETGHYVTINSEDRLWENDAENRYDFVVHFNSSDFTNGAAVIRGFKNVVAIELLKLIVPQDHFPIPFDHRLFVEFLSFPFLSLHIDELDGVYNGTNNNVSRAFEHLVFDKEYMTELMTSEQITNELNTSGVKHKYSRQFKRGHYALKPMCGGSKIYYHTPKASLNRMTIKLLTSEGRQLNTLNDHLKITAIDFEAVSNQELKSSNGFPRTTGQEIIKITTTDYFNNRTFKIGDKIKVKNYTISSSAANEAKFQSFINRDEGHYIINLDEEENGSSVNEGYINTIFIAPPGDIDFTTGTLDTNSYYTVSPTVSDYGDLLNTTLQMHVMFRVTVREDKTRDVIHPHNV